MTPEELDIALEDFYQYCNTYWGLLDEGGQDISWDQAVKIFADRDLDGYVRLARQLKTLRTDYMLPHNYEFFVEGMRREYRLMTIENHKPNKGG